MEKYSILRKKDSMAIRVLEYLNQVEESNYTAIAANMSQFKDYNLRRMKTHIKYLKSSAIKLRLDVEKGDRELKELEQLDQAIQDWKEFNQAKLKEDKDFFLDELYRTKLDSPRNYYYFINNASTLSLSRVIKQLKNLGYIEKLSWGLYKITEIGKDKLETINGN